MLNQQERCEFCPCKCMHCVCSDASCVVRRILFICVILLIVLVVAGSLFIRNETAREETVRFVGCMQHTPSGVILQLWDSKLTDESFFAPLRTEEHANFTLALPSSSVQGVSIFSARQIVWKVFPRDCPDGIQFLVMSPSLNDSSYVSSYTPISVSTEGQTLHL